MTKKLDKYIFAVGRRKESVARVRLFAGKGESLVNDRPAKEYFLAALAQKQLLAPYEATGTLGKFYATVKVEGGGLVGQLGAVVHGLSRALVKADPKFQPALKKGNFLTRDARVKERRKFGLAQKARARKQSPKR